MNSCNKHFLSILKAAILDNPAPDCDTLTAEEWADLTELALKHKILPLFAEAIQQIPGAHEALASHKSFIRQNVITQALKTREFLALYQALDAAGIRPVVVKGIICRNLYCKPDHRISSDEDLLVPPDQFDDACSVIKEFGMTAPAHGPDAYEVPFRKPGGSLFIELHRSLFPPESEAYGDWNRFFTGVFDHAVPETIAGNAISTLEPTDHLFYLICHALKHFLHSGFGIRQVCDIVLFANAYGPQLDWNRIMEQCAEIHAVDFAAAIFRIGENHLTFDPVKACYPKAWRIRQVDEEPMLEDLLSGGIYGSASISRIHSSNITLDAMAADRQGKQRRGSVIASLFPSARKLEAGYPYLKKHPWLLPVAWCQRIVKYGTQIEKNTDNSALDAVKIGSRRVELLRLYGLICIEERKR